MPELEEALADFAVCRSATIADAVELLGRAAAEGFAPPKITKNLTFHQAWIAGVADPRTRSWYLDKILDKLPKLSAPGSGKEVSWGEKSDAVVERVDVLAKLDPDPRIGRALIATALLRSPVLSVGEGGEAMARAMIVHGDDEASASPALEEMVWDEAAVKALATKLPKRATGKQIAKWAKHATPSKAKLDVTELLAAVYADPDSDGPREVLADAMQAANDPRGEFIALQLREANGDRSEALVVRATELCKEHGKDWLGSLRAVTYRANLRRGFLSRLEMAGSWATKDWAKVHADPALRTVERLDAGQATGKTYARMLEAIVATVRDIEIFEDLIFDVAARQPMPRLTGVRSFHWKGRADHEERFTTTLLPWLEKQPNITTLGVRNTSQLDELSKRFAGRLAHVIVHDDLTEAAAIWAKFPKLASLTTGFNTRVELYREGKTQFARIYPDKYGWGGATDLKRLPATIKRVEVIGNAKATKELQAKHPKLDIVAALAPSGFVTGVK